MWSNLEGCAHGDFSFTGSAGCIMSLVLKLNEQVKLLVYLNMYTFINKQIERIYGHGTVKAIS